MLQYLTSGDYGSASKQEEERLEAGSERGVHFRWNGRLATTISMPPVPYPFG